jgi:pimeloyl-ACP methyl ester carboxylesterase
MKKYSISFLIILSIVKTVTGQSINQSLNNSIMKLQNVKTSTVNVAGTEFSYRKLGLGNDAVPVIFLNHLSATMDDSDPKIIDGLAAEHTVIIFDNRGIGSTGGVTPKTVAEMATDAIAFIKAIGYQQVDLFGFSLGGFISQEILLREPQLVRKAILAGTGPAGGEGISNMTPIVVKDIIKSRFTFRNEKYYLFFNNNATGHQAAKSYLTRLKERTENRGKKLKLKHFSNQLSAIKDWGLKAPQDLSKIKQPVLIVNGEDDKMVLSSNSLVLKKNIPNSELILFKDSGHGGIFQYSEEFVKSALKFLQD